MQAFEPPDGRRTRADALGVITHGSLSEGVDMKLDAGQSVEAVNTGTFAVIQGEQHDFFCLITDARIEAANDGILLYPPPASERVLRRVMQGASTYATVALKPMLMLPNAHNPDLAGVRPRPVKTVPAHFSPVYKADTEDVTTIFGSEHNDPSKYFEIGSPLDMDGVPVCLDLERFVERSSAVFGRTGTGKTFITRLLLAGTVKSGRAVNLIFDAHSEYGWEGTQEGEGTQGFVKGLKQLFPDKVSIVTLDESYARKRNVPTDFTAFLYADQIEPADILPLQDTLGLNATAADSAYLLYDKHRHRWLEVLLRAEGEAIKELAADVGAHEGSIEALRRKLLRLKSFGFFSLEPSQGKKDVLAHILDCIQAGRSVVFEFGQYQAVEAYLLVAGVITRRLRDRYEDLVAKYQASKNKDDEPRRLLITIEEAHRFLAPGIARETPFGKIAREMRKFYVSLLIVDQRPSAIDDEVLSQIGTKFVAALSDEKDIAAALTGTSGSTALRAILASLDTKQQMLALGHAFVMPIVVRTRSYNQDFYDAVRPPRAPAKIAAFADDFDTQPARR